MYVLTAMITLLCFESDLFTPQAFILFENKLDYDHEMIMGLVDSLS